MKNKSCEFFWQNLYRISKQRFFPLRVMFELTYRCPFFCPHCYVPAVYRKSKELKTEEILRIIGQLADIGCFYLGFTGGEPFVRKDILKILEFSIRKGFQVIIYTNGSLINEDTARELSGLGLNKVDITIPAMSQRIFERITKVKGSHKKVFCAIELLKSYGVPLGFKTCVLRENQDEIGDIQKFARSLDALHRLDDMLSRRLDGSDKPYRYKGGQKGDRLLFASFSEEQKIKHKKQPVPFFKCGAGRTQAAITPQGELKPCLMIDTPRYRILSGRWKVKGGKDGLKEAWEKLKRFVAGIKPDENYKCASCGLAAYCKWCPARGWLYNRSFSSCAPESLATAQSIAELCKQK